MNQEFDDEEFDDEPDESTPKEVQRRNHPSASGRKKLPHLSERQFYAQDMHFTKVRELISPDGERTHREYAIGSDDLDKPSISTHITPFFPGSSDWSVTVIGPNGPVKSPFNSVPTRGRAEMVERGMVSRLAGPTGSTKKSALRQYDEVQEGINALEKEANK
jgi:hypothetical protein